MAKKDEVRITKIQNWRRTVRSSEQREDTGNADFARKRLHETLKSATAEERAAADERGI